MAKGTDNLRDSIDHYNKLIMHLIYLTNETVWDVTGRPIMNAQYACAE